MSPVLTQEHWIASPHGALYAKSWEPTDAAMKGSESLAPLVLLHESLGCVEVWRDFPAQLAQATQRRVIAYDRLGFGRSAAHPGALSSAVFIHDEAQGDFQRVRHALDIERFVVLGHSVGGGMAVGCAAEHAGDCEGVVTVSAQAFVEDRTVQGIRVAQALFADPAQVQRLVKYHGSKAQWVLDAWIQTWLTPALASWTLDADLAQVVCKALVLHGDQDEYGSSMHLQRIAQGVQGAASSHLLPNCGHVPHREQPAQVLALIAAWL
ncbi:alpha/beta fold hydrolase [Lampropedia aestuarii]|uniref:alpha/beta fold hydrolase n=1 Tax=Lampropedia aestuarii TaxID=2562762 RepID=UPI002468A2D4|nr:alpha/beta hydrolase [Lampropedia aestuarii]MDH5858689.1 alpha/beta hydrolase [Lampropedia aestuarii]